MWWFHHGTGGWGFLAMALLWIGFWALVVTAAVLVVRHLVRAGPDDRREGPERILAERYARGEIDDEEYRRRLDTIRSTG
ncbi:MAG TPA: SHOCT domain-containing protein [Natronosporangium sp.]|nr:SHOCT domain-containing protein [Natronosporangium sp.]